MLDGAHRGGGKESGRVDGGGEAEWGVFAIVKGPESRSRIMSDVARGEKEEAYRELVKQRKQCCLCEGLTNPSQISEYDSDEIGPWSLWQGSLDAKILLVGQDWGDVRYFKKRGGIDEDNNPTNRNLGDLFQSIEIPLEGPESPIKNGGLFFTNVILCLKKGGLSAPVEEKHALSCGKHYLKPLVSIINPKVVIALGEKAYRSVCACYGLKPAPFKDAVMVEHGFPLTLECRLFPVYHCGARGWNINRKGPLQIQDWEKIGSYLHTRTG